MGDDRALTERSAVRTISACGVQRLVNLQSANSSELPCVFCCYGNISQPELMPHHWRRHGRSGESMGECKIGGFCEDTFKGIVFGKTLLF